MSKDNMKKTFASFLFAIIALAVFAYVFASHISVSGDHIVVMMDMRAIVAFSSSIVIAVTVILVALIRRKLAQK